MEFQSMIASGRGRKLECSDNIFLPFLPQSHLQRKMLLRLALPTIAFTPRRLPNPPLLSTLESKERSAWLLCGKNKRNSISLGMTLCCSYHCINPKNGMQFPCAYFPKRCINLDLHSFKLLFSYLSLFLNFSERWTIQRS